MPRSIKKSNIFFTTNLNEDLREFIGNYKSDRIFTLVDEHSHQFCLPKIAILSQSHIIEIKSGEENKTIDAVVLIWKHLSNMKADRKSLFINLGGGMLGDVGGFAASTFKRGIDFVNIPTTLLAQVDASVGGKTGINLFKFKNEIGVINQPKRIFIDTNFLGTLDDNNFLSGLGEMLKHSLLDSEEHFQFISGFDFSKATKDELNNAIKKSVEIKRKIVEQDPYEKNIRKALNFGHSVGHAIESYYQRRNKEISHGIAVASGLVNELYLSHKKTGLKSQAFESIIKFIKQKFQKISLSENDIPELIEIIKHDKKNENEHIYFTLLEDFGKAAINIKCTEEDIRDALQFYINTY